MPGRLDGKVAIVTGGGGGFGKGIAEKFVAEGAKVLIVDMNEEVGKKTAGEIKAEFIKGNVTERKSWEEILKVADEKFGKLDVIVNNAGTTYRNKVIHYGYTHTFTQRLTHRSLPTMLPTKTSTKSWLSMSSLSITLPTLLYLIYSRRERVALLLTLLPLPVFDHGQD